MFYDFAAVHNLSLIGLTGAAGCGKDTLADWLVENFDVTKISLAEPIKEGLNAMLGFGPVHWNDRDWKERPLNGLGVSPRVLAQTLGTEWGRNHSEDFWLNVLFRRWEKLGHPLTVVPDVRFDNEAKSVIDRGGIVIKIERESAANIAAHSSEAGISPEYISATVPNDSSISEFTETALRAILNPPKYRLEAEQCRL